MLTNFEELTEPVLTVKVAEVKPAGTSTLAGAVATAGLLLDSITVAPPDGAGAPNTTVPTELYPLATVWGFKVRVIVGLESFEKHIIPAAGLGVPPLPLEVQVAVTAPALGCVALAPQVGKVRVKSCLINGLKAVSDDGSPFPP